MGKKVLAIGGGGALGAVTVGRLAFKNEKYDVIVGVSTGALMSPLVALASKGYTECWERLKTAYTTTTNKDIFKRYPFTKDGSLQLFNALWSSLLGRWSVGNTEPVVSMIKKWFTLEDYETLQGLDIEIIFAVLNVTTGRVEYISSHDSHSYEDFCRYMGAASSPELIGSLFDFDGWEYADSGLATLVPLVKASKVKDVEEIHCYTHRCFDRVTKNRKPLMRFRFLQIIKAMYRYVLIQRENLEHKELREGVLRCLMKGIKIKCMFLDTSFSKTNTMTMNPKLMLKMWEYGYNNADNANMNRVFTLDNWEQLFDKQDDE